VRELEPSILSKGIYEIGAKGATTMNFTGYREKKSVLVGHVPATSFKFSIDCYGSTRDVEQQRQIINSLRYLDFRGKIKMKDPEVEL